MIEEYSEEGIKKFLKSFRFNGYYIPEYMHEDIVMYLMEGKLYGDFLISVFTNDFKGTAQNADSENMNSLPAYAALLIHVPIISQGSPDVVNAWMNKGGVLGLQKESHLKVV
mgnify:CR=1 FL=1